MTGRATLGRVLLAGLGLVALIGSSARANERLLLAQATGNSLGNTPAPTGRGMGNTPSRPAPPVAAPSPAPVAPPKAAAPPAASAAAPRPVAPPVAAAPAAVPPAATAPLPPFSIAESPGGYTVQNIGFALGPIRYRVPRAEIRGTSLSRDELARLLDPASAVPLAERVGKLAASEIAVPEMTSESTGPEGRQATTYRDVLATDVRTGRIASVRSGSGTFSTSAAKGAGDGSFTGVSATDIDVGLTIALFNEPAGDRQDEMRRLYGSFSLDGMVSREASGTVVRIARISGRDFNGRRTRDGWTESMRRFSETSDLDKATPEVRAGVYRGLIDILQAFEIGSLEATGIEFAGNDPKAGSGRIARIGYAGGASPSEFRMDGLDVTSESGQVRLASAALSGFSLTPMLAAAREYAGMSKDELSPAQLRRLIPTLGEFKMGGLEFTPKAGTATPTPGASAFSLASFEIRTDKPVEGVPSDVRFGLRNLAIRLDAANADENAKQLLDLGYDRIDASLAASIGWNEAGQELVVRDLSVQAAEMGGVAVRAVLGNVTKDVFDPDTAVASVALIGAGVKSIDVAVENTGLFDRVLRLQAGRQGRQPDDLRREFGVMAAMGVPMMLGGSDAAKAIGQAVAKFVAKPGRLLLQARAKQASGVGAPDFLAGGSDPTAILDKFNVTATVQ